MHWFVFACGSGCNGQLGLGHSEDEVLIPTHSKSSKN